MLIITGCHGATHQSCLCVPHTKLYFKVFKKLPLYFNGAFMTIHYWVNYLSKTAKILKFII